MAKKTIAMFNLTETRRDPRVRRIASAIADMGHRVIVFGIKSEVTESYEKLDNFEIVRVDIPMLYTEKEMMEIGRLCKNAEDMLYRCDPLVVTKDIGLFNILQIKINNKYNKLKMKIKSNRNNTVKEFNTEQEILAIRSIMLINLNLYKEAFKYKPDVVHCNDLDTLLTGYMLKTNLNIPLIFDAHEIYPEQLAVHMRSDIWHNFYTRLEDKLLKYTDGRMTVCDSLGEYFKKNNESEDFITIRNVVSKKYLPDESILDRNNSSIRILYHGAYFQYRGLDEIIEAAPLVSNAKFVFRGVGQYETVLKEKVKEKNLEKIISFEPPVGVNELVSKACENDIGLNPFISVCKNTEYALPNKFFEYMMAGLAIVSSDLVEMRNLTQKLQIGELFLPDKPDNIANALNKFTSSPEKLRQARFNAYKAAKQEYNWENEKVKLHNYYTKFL